MLPSSWNYTNERQRLPTRSALCTGAWRAQGKPFTPVPAQPLCADTRSLFSQGAQRRKPDAPAGYAGNGSLSCTPIAPCPSWARLYQRANLYIDRPTHSADTGLVGLIRGARKAREKRVRRALSVYLFKKKIICRDGTFTIFLRILFFACPKPSKKLVNLKRPASFKKLRLFQQKLNIFQMV